MDRRSADSKIACLLVITVEMLLYKVLSKELNFVVSANATANVALEIPKAKVESRLVESRQVESRQAVPPSKKKNFKATDSCSPIFSIEETLKTRSLSLALLKESKIYIECQYEIKKLRIRHKACKPKHSLENLFNI